MGTESLRQRDQYVQRHRGMEMQDEASSLGGLYVWKGIWIFGF